MNIKLYIISVLFIFSFVGYGQSNWDTAYYKKYSIDNFKDYKPFSEQVDFDNIDYPLLHACIFYYTNVQRDKKRLPVLTYAPQLETAAYFHSKSMAEKNYFDHFNNKERNRKTPNDRIKLAGISNPYAAENIIESFGLVYEAGEEVIVGGPGQFKYPKSSEWIQAQTYLTLAFTMVDGWMHSPPHKKNILSKDAVQLGCGAYFYIDKRFNSMPMFKATQNFQLYEPIKAGSAEDKFPF